MVEIALTAALAAGLTQRLQLRRGRAGRRGSTSRRCGRSRTRPAPARAARRSARPRPPGRPRAGAGRRSARGWSSSRRRGSRRSRLGVDRVDAAAHHLAGEHQRERRLDRVRRPVGERARLEGRDQLAQVGVVVDRRVAAARQLVGVEERPAGRTAPRPRRGSGCRTGRPATAAAASAGPGRGRRPSGSSRSRASAVADRLRRQRHLDLVGALAARLGEQPLELVVPLARPGPPRPGRARRRSAAASAAPSTASRTSAAAASRRTRLGGLARHRPGHATGRRVAAGWRRPSSGLSCQLSGSPPQPASASRTVALVGRGPERRLAAARLQQVRRDRQPVPGPGERDVAQPQLLDRLVLPGRRAVARRAPPWSQPRELRQVARVAAQRRREHRGRRRSTACALRLVGNLLSAHADQEHGVPLQPLGAVDGQQLDRVGLGGGRDVEARCRTRPRPAR